MNYRSMSKYLYIFLFIFLHGKAMKRPKIRYILSISIVLIFALTLTLIPAFTYKPSLKDIIASCIAKESLTRYYYIIAYSPNNLDGFIRKSIGLNPVIEPTSSTSCCQWDYKPYDNGCPAGYTKIMAYKVPRQCLSAIMYNCPACVAGCIVCLGTANPCFIICFSCAQCVINSATCPYGQWGYVCRKCIDPC